MYYGSQQWPSIMAMNEWQREYAYDAIFAVIRAEQRNAENSRKQSERDAKMGQE